MAHHTASKCCLLTLTRPLSFALALSICALCLRSLCDDRYMVPSAEKVMCSADSDITAACVCRGNALNTLKS